jgi:hypothetical protein
MLYRLLMYNLLRGPEPRAVYYSPLRGTQLVA